MRQYFHSLVDFFEFRCSVNQFGVIRETSVLSTIVHEGDYLYKKAVILFFSILARIFSSLVDFLEEKFEIFFLYVKFADIFKFQTRVRMKICYFNHPNTFMILEGIYYTFQICFGISLVDLSSNWVKKLKKRIAK